MALKVGILGLGFMGKCHYETYAKVRGARVVAICDGDPKKRSGDWSTIAGNIGGKGGRVDLSHLTLYAKAEAMFADPSIDVIDITLPTYLHAEYAIKALKAGKHVICEKPMARTSVEAKKMLQTAKAAKKKLFVGHCIRYWPEYATAREIVKSKKYGKVKSATFRRYSSTPVWSWKNWLMDVKKSGACALDLHIHDADFVLYCFGKPKTVQSSGSGFKTGQLDHVTTAYQYPGNCTVVAEGGWDFAPGFGFEMAFQIVMEKATLVCGADMSLTLHPMKGKSKKIKTASGDGYLHELRDFIDCIATGRASKVLTPDSAVQSVKLIECEEKAARSGKPVAVKL